MQFRSRGDALLLAAIRNGQPEEAAQAMQTHLDTVVASYQQEVRRRLIGEIPNE
jgi:DNA-binding FadR family transcriptional regulator